MKNLTYPIIDPSTLTEEQRFNIHQAIDMKTELTIEESAKLIELGVDHKMASLKEFVPIHPEVLKGNAEYAKPWGWFPKFRLDDILSILPKEIEDSNLDIISTQVDIKNHKKVSGWMVTYINSYNDLAFGDESVFQAPELIDALNQLAIWYLENKIIKLKED